MGTTVYGLEAVEMAERLGLDVQHYKSDGTLESVLPTAETRAAAFEDKGSYFINPWKDLAILYRACNIIATSFAAAEGIDASEKSIKSYVTIAMSLAEGSIGENDEKRVGL